MRIRQLNHVALHVRDVAVSRRFYGQVLGLAEMARPAFDFPGAWFEIAPASGDLPPQELHLIGREPAEQSPPRERHFALLIDDADAMATHLRSAGWEFSGPKPRPDEALQIFLRDPDGHVIELCTLPARNGLLPAEGCHAGS